MGRGEEVWGGGQSEEGKGGVGRREEWKGGGSGEEGGVERRGE